MADTYFVPVAERYLVVQGRVSVQSRDKFSQGLPEKWPSNSILLFLAYSNIEVPVGHTFEVIFQLDSPRQHIETDCRISAVTQQFAKPYDSIPRGWKTISIIEFPTGIPDIIQNSPTLDSWGGPESIGIASKETWALLTEQPGTERWVSEELWRYTPLKHKYYSACFSCPQCREYTDVVDQWAYWKLEMAGVISMDAPVSVSKVLEANDYWAFKSRGDHRDNLIVENIAVSRKFFEKHKEHQVHLMRKQIPGYKEFRP